MGGVRVKVDEVREDVGLGPGESEVGWVGGCGVGSRTLVGVKGEVGCG